MATWDSVSCLRDLKIHTLRLCRATSPTPLTLPPKSFDRNCSCRNNIGMPGLPGIHCECCEKDPCMIRVASTNSNFSQAKQKQPGINVVAPWCPGDATVFSSPCSSVVLHHVCFWLCRMKKNKARQGTPPKWQHPVGQNLVIEPWTSNKDSLKINLHSEHVCG